jgi:hypothetical protein
MNYTSYSYAPRTLIVSTYSNLIRNCTRILLSSLHTPLFCVRIFLPHLQASIANVIPAFKHTTQEVIDFYKAQGATPIPGVPKFDARRVVDGQRKLLGDETLPISTFHENISVSGE